MGNYEFFSSCWKFLVLGLIQGLTEFLPISSTAHLKVVPLLLGWDDPGISVTAVIQLGSIAAVIIYFRKELKELIKGISIAIRHNQWHETNARLGIAIWIGTLPIIIGGMIAKLYWTNFQESALRSIKFIGLISIAMALFLAIAEQKKQKKKMIKNINIKDGLIIGLAQMFALLPGVSRSGITLSTALITGWRRPDAARFSFLLGIPAISLAGIVEIQNALISETTNLYELLIPLLIGITSAGLMSWITIDWLIKFLQTNNSWIFVAYRFIFGIILIIWW